MQQKLTDLSKEKLTAIIQDYQEIVSELESYLNQHSDLLGQYRVIEELREILYKERPGWNTPE